MLFFSPPNDRLRGNDGLSAEGLCHHDFVDPDPDTGRDLQDADYDAERSACSSVQAVIAMLCRHTGTEG